MRQWTGLATVLGLGVVCLAVCPEPSFAEGGEFVGRWHWDRKQSQLPMGEAEPTDMIVEIPRLDSLHVRWSVTITNAHGRPVLESFDAPANGEFYPISSGTTASFRLKGSTLDAIFKGPSGEADKLSCIVSADQKRMDCAGETSGPDGKSQSYRDVYSRM